MNATGRALRVESLGGCASLPAHGAAAGTADLAPETRSAAAEHGGVTERQLALRLVRLVGSGQRKRRPSPGSWNRTSPEAPGCAVFLALGLLLSLLLLGHTALVGITYGAFGTYLLSSVFSSLPRELIEAAYMDGAGRWTILWHIVLPMSWPTLSVMCVFFYVWSWNEFLYPLVLLIANDIRKSAHRGSTITPGPARIAPLRVRGDMCDSCGR